MKKNAKQSTLFHSWAKPNTQQNEVLDPVPYDTENLSKRRPETSMQREFIDVESELVDSLDDFFMDDIADEVAKDRKLDVFSGSASAVKPAPSLNTSLYEEIPGFDMESGKTYIYPTNFPIRDYQFNIVKKCLFKNTLVSLPTGLGKTFIAAVLMYNYYRWYPNKKVVFLAPTKPLVSQQIEACFGIMGMNENMLY